MKRPPCYECPERHVGCHSKCPRYGDWAALNQKRLEAMEMERVKDAVTMARQTGKMGVFLARKKKGLITR